MTKHKINYICLLSVGMKILIALSVLLCVASTKHHQELTITDSEYNVGPGASKAALRSAIELEEGDEPEVTRVMSGSDDDEQLIRSVTLATRNMRSQLEDLENLYGPIGGAQEAGESDGVPEGYINPIDVTPDSDILQEPPNQSEAQPFNTGLLTIKRKPVHTDATRGTKYLRKDVNLKQQVPRGTLQKRSSNIKTSSDSVGRNTSPINSALKITSLDYDLGDSKIESEDSAGPVPEEKDPFSSNNEESTSKCSGKSSGCNRIPSPIVENNQDDASSTTSYLHPNQIYNKIEDVEHVNLDEINIGLTSREQILSNADKNARQIENSATPTVSLTSPAHILSSVDPSSDLLPIDGNDDPSPSEQSGSEYERSKSQSDGLTIRNQFNSPVFSSDHSHPYTDDPHGVGGGLNISPHSTDQSNLDKTSNEYNDAHRILNGHIFHLDPVSETSDFNSPYPGKGIINHNKGSGQTTNRNNQENSIGQNESMKQEEPILNPGSQLKETAKEEQFADNNDPVKYGLPTMVYPEHQEGFTQNIVGTGTVHDAPAEVPRYDLKLQPEETTGVDLFSTDPSNATLLATYTGVTRHIENLSYKKTAYEDYFNDPYWEKQWYVQDYRTVDGPVMDHNVVPVYHLGYTGKGVTVAVVDDGVQRHPDLVNNYVEELSHDLCQDRPGAEPEPTKDGAEAHSHGTQCAGVIAMQADNEMCGVGVAFEAKVAGIKTFGNRTAEYTEGKGLAYNLAHFDIYSCSWGPPDDGVSMQPLGHLSLDALHKGASQGRRGKGVVYAFAAGNGRDKGDTCGADAVVNNVYTIAVAAATQRGHVAYYSERCAGIFCAAYSGGVRGEEYVSTTTLDQKCTKRFTGTSAAVPLATGIIALVLDANPKLTYRDVMHIITMGAEVAPLADNPADIWQRNSMGLWASNDFGFGILNALNMVRLADSWTNVPEMKTCVVSVKIPQPTPLVLGKGVHIKLSTLACQDSQDDQIFFLEKTQLMVTIEFGHRGALTIALISARKTKSVLLETRQKDTSAGMVDWLLATVHNWGEDPKGEWIIEVKANRLEGLDNVDDGEIHKLTLILHGTAERPRHYDRLPPLRTYSAFRLRDGRTSDDPLPLPQSPTP